MTKKSHNLKFIIDTILIVTLSVLISTTSTIAQCPPATITTCMPAPFISATYSPGYACKDDGRTVAEIINWSGTFGSGPNSNGTEAVVFMVMCTNALPPPAAGQLGLYWNTFSQPGKLELDDEIGDYINCNGNWQIGPNTCTGQICLYPVTVYAVVGNTGCYDPTCFAAAPPVCVQLSAACANPTSTPVCDGQTTTLNANGSPAGSTYQWSNGLGSTATVTAMPTGPTTYTVTVTSSTLSTCTVEKEVTVTPMPNVTTILGPIGPLCLNSTPPPLPNASSNAPPIIGTWSPSNINTSSPGTTIYTFTPNQGQCGTVEQISITILDNIMPMVGPFGPYCINATPDVLPASSNDMPPINGTWNPTTINTSTAGTTPYTFTPATGSGCAVPTIINITVNDEVLPIFTPISPICINRNAPSLPTSSNNIPPITGTWNPAIINTSMAGTFNFTFTPAANQCASTTTIPVVITPEIVPIFTPIPPICQGDAPPSLSGSSNNSPPIIGTWAPSTINTNNPGTTTYTFTPDPSECASIFTVDIIINPDIAPTFNPIGPLCQNSSPPALPNSSLEGISGTWSPAVINTNAIGFTTYTFTGTSTPCATSTIQIEIVGNPLPTFTALGPYCLNATPDVLPNISINGIQGTWSPASINTNMAGSLVYTFTPNAGVCALPTTMTVNIVNPITPTFSFDVNYCQNENPDNLPLNSNNGINGTWSPSFISTANSGITAYTFTPNASFCALPVVINVTVNSPQVPIFIPDTYTFCQNTAPSTLPLVSNNSITGTWNPAVINTSNVGSFIYTFTPNVPQCATITTITVDITPAPIPTFVQVGPICQNEVAPILPNVSQEGINGTWSPTTINTLSPGTFNFTFTPTSGSCGTSTNMMVTIWSSPTNISSNISPASCGQNDGTLNITSVTGGSSPYEYNFNNTGFSSNTFFGGLPAGTFPLTVRDVNGCEFLTFITISNANGPTNLTFTTNVETCFDSNGSVTITNVTGGNSPFSYSFDNGPFTTTLIYSGLTEGTYPIAVSDANNCVFSTIVQIVNIPGPTDIVINTSAASCGNSNGTIMLGNVTGGLPPYTFSIDGSVFTSITNYTNLMSGTFDVIVRDANGCEYMTTATISEITGPTNLSTTISNANCGQPDGSVTLNQVTGGVSPYLFSFNGSPFTSTVTYQGLLAGNYSVIVQDAGGCQYNTSVNVNNVGGPNNADISVVHTSCGIANGSITINNVIGGATPFTYSLNGSPFSSNTSYTNLQPNTYTVIIKDMNNCTFISNAVINTSSRPDTIGTTIIAPNCGLSDGSIIINNVTGGTSPYEYSFNTSNFTANTQYTNLGSGLYTIVVKDAKNCLDTSYFQLMSPNGPGSMVVQMVNETCSMDNGSINITNVTGGVSPYTYSLNGSAFTTTTQYLNLPSGTYTIVVKDVNNCSLDRTISLSDITGPNDIAISTTMTNCGTANGSVTLSNVMGGTPPYLFSFNGSSFTTQTIYQNLASGVYPVTVRDATGCQLIRNAQVNNNGGPTDILTVNMDPKCGLNDGSITILNPVNGQGPFLYSIDNMGYTTNTIYNALNEGDHILSVQDVNGCIFSKTITLTDSGNFIAAFSKIDPSCGLNNGSINVIPSGSEYTYSWSGGLSGSNPINVAAGTYQVTVTQINSGCTKTLTITLLPSISIDIQCTPTNVTVQNGNDGKNDITITGGNAPYSISWNGASIGNLTNQLSKNISILNFIVGDYTLIVTDINGCTAMCSFQIKDVDCQMTADATGTITSCFGGTDGKIELSISNAIGNTQIRWSNPIWDNLNAITNASPGSYNVTITDEAQCTVNESVLIGQPTLLTLNCAAKGVSVEGANDGAGMLVITGGTPNYTVSWSGPLSGNLTNIPSGNFNIVNLSAGQYVVTVIDNNNCTQICNFEVAESNCMLSTVISKEDIDCFGACNGQIAVNVSGAIGQHNIKWNDPQFDGKYQLTQLCKGNYSATITDEDGCTTEVNLTLTEPSDWKVALNANKNVVLLNETVNLNLTTTIPNERIASIQWKSDDQLSCTNCFSPLAKMLNTTTFEVIVTDILGCQKTANITIQIREVFELYFPNIININSQSGNQIFYPKGDLSKIKLIKKMRIYDRWGNLVFQRENMQPNQPNEGWNGSFGGKQPVLGVYVYVAECEFNNGSIEIFRGDISVVQ